MFFDFSFWQGFVGNLLATIVGVGIGIPVAFWINKRVGATTEKEKKSKILLSLSDELSENLRYLDIWPEDIHEMTKYINPDWIVGSCMKLGDEVWNAFSDGGELEWITDTVLLKELANVYGTIKRIKYFGDLYLNAPPDSGIPRYPLLEDIGTAKIVIPYVIASIQKHSFPKKEEMSENGITD